MATATTFEETKNYDSFMTTGSAPEALEVSPDVRLLESLEAQRAPFFAHGLRSDSTTRLEYVSDRGVPHFPLTYTRHSVVERRFVILRGGRSADDTSRFLELDETESDHTIQGSSNLPAPTAERTIILVDGLLRDWAINAIHGRLSLHEATLAFSEGFDGIRPSPDTLKNAENLVRAAVEKCARADIDVDDNTGSLAFDLRLSDGALLFAEIEVSGKLNADLFDDKGEEAIWVQHFPNPSFSDLMDVL